MNTQGEGLWRQSWRLEGSNHRTPGASRNWKRWGELLLLPTTWFQTLELEESVSVVLSIYICGELLHQSQETNAQPKLMGASGLSGCTCIPPGLAELQVASSFLSSDLSTSLGLTFSERPSSTPQPLLMGPQHSLLHYPVFFSIALVTDVIIVCNL